MFCLQIHPENFVLRFSARSDDLLLMQGASAIAENGNTYFKCVAIFLRRTLCRNMSVRDAVRVLVLFCHNYKKTKYFLSKWIREFHENTF